MNEYLVRGCFMREFFMKLFFFSLTQVALQYFRIEASIWKINLFLTTVFAFPLHNLLLCWFFLFKIPKNLYLMLSGLRFNWRNVCVQKHPHTRRFSKIDTLMPIRYIFMSSIPTNRQISSHVRHSCNLQIKHSKKSRP